MNLLYFSLTIIFLLVTTSDLAYSQTIEDGEKIEVTNTIDETITMKEIVESIHKSIPIEDGKTDISITINNMINSNEKNSCEIDCEISKEKDIFEWVDFFSDIVSVGVPIIGAVTFYISRRRGDKRRIINSLLIELRQNLRGFATDENGQQRKNEDFAGWNFTTSAFKATVNTGYFAHFRGNTQNSLNDLYYRLETHNKILDNMNLSADIARMQGIDPPENKFTIQEAELKFQQKNILKEFPEVIEKVEKELPRKLFVI